MSWDDLLEYGIPLLIIALGVVFIALSILGFVVRIIRGLVA